MTWKPVPNKRYFWVCRCGAPTFAVYTSPTEVIISPHLSKNDPAGGTCQNKTDSAGAHPEDELQDALDAWRGLSEAQREIVCDWIAGAVGAAPEAMRLLRAAAR